MFLVRDNKNSVEAEAYRILTTNIKYSLEVSKSKIILVTSPKEGDGKTTVAVNFAATMADYGKKVIILDLNLRHPNLHNIFNLNNNKGISNLVEESISVDQIINNTFLGIDVISVGSIVKNRYKILSSDNVESLILALNNVYDYIIIDAASVLTVADTQILATYVDGVLLVVKERTVTVNEINLVKKSFERVGANIIGTVLNNVDRKIYVKRIKRNIT